MTNKLYIYVLQPKDSLDFKGSDDYTDEDFRLWGEEMTFQEFQAWFNYADGRDDPFNMEDYYIRFLTK
jgi:hypothetical protein